MIFLRFIATIITYLWVSYLGFTIFHGTVISGPLLKSMQVGIVPLLFGSLGCFIIGAIILGLSAMVLTIFFMEHEERKR